MDARINNSSRKTYTVYLSDLCSKATEAQKTTQETEKPDAQREKETMQQEEVRRQKEREQEEYKLKRQREEEENRLKRQREEEENRLKRQREEEDYRLRRQREEEEEERIRMKQQAEEDRLRQEREAQEARIRREQQAEEDRRRQEREHIEKLARMKEAEQARQEEAERKKIEKQKRKESVISSFQDIQPKPKTIPDGWYEATVIKVNDDVLDNQRFRVEKNKVVAVSFNNLPFYDEVRDVESGIIKNGQAAVRDGSDYCDVYFELPLKQLSAPERDERSLWWNQLGNALCDAISAGKAYIDDKAVIFNRHDLTKADLDKVEKITRIELPAEEWNRVSSSLHLLAESGFKSLKSVPVHIKSKEAVIIFNSPTELRMIKPYVVNFVLALDRQWITMLKGGTGSPSGAYSGDQPVRFDLDKLLQAADLQQIQQNIDKIDIIYFPNSVSTTSSVTTHLLNRYFPNLRELNFNNNNNFHFSHFDNFPGITNLEFIRACNTPAALHWKKELKKRKERNKFMERMKSTMPKLAYIEFCVK